MPKTVRKRRTRLSRRLSKFKLFRILNKDRGFAVAFLLLLTLAALILGGTQRIFSSTPPQYQGPALRISGLDWLQAWSLKRSALELSAAGRHEESLYTWRAAVARNLGDPALHRGMLAHLLQMPAPAPINRILAETSVQWLARLTSTNAAEAPLQARALERYDAPRAGLALLQTVPAGHAAAIDDAFQRALAICLLSSGEVTRFGALWQERGSEWSADPVLALYGQAWIACSDRGARGLEAVTQLRSTAQGNDLRAVVAARLLLLTGEQRLDPEDLSVAVRELDRLKAGTTGDHLRFWLQLVASDQQARAKAEASKYRGIPLDAATAARYVSLLLDLDLGPQALEFLEANIQEYGAESALWQAYFDALIRMERWSELRRACASARLLSSRQESLQGEVAHAELRAALAAQRAGDAERAAPEVARSTYASADRLLAAAGTLLQARRAQDASTLLARFESLHLQDPEYWLMRFRVAMLRQDLGAVRHAVDELTRLRPESPAVDLARAGLLLVAEENESEALRLTFSAFQRQPHLPAVRINHAFALLRNQRAAEAVPVLEGLATNHLSQDLRVQLALARAELAAALGRMDDARTAAAEVPDAELFPLQRARLARLRATAAAPARP